MPYIKWGSMKKLFCLAMLIIDVALYFVVFKFEDGAVARKFFTYDVEMYNLTQSYKTALQHSYPAKATVTYLKGAPKTEEIIHKRHCINSTTVIKEYRKEHPLPNPMEPPKIIIPKGPVPTPSHSSLLPELFENMAARGSRSKESQTCGELIYTRETWGLVEYEDSQGKHNGVLSYITVLWKDPNNIYTINKAHIDPPEVGKDILVFVNPNDSENVMYESDYMLQAVIEDIPHLDITLRPGSLFKSYSYLYPSSDSYSGTAYTTYFIVSGLFAFVFFMGIFYA